MSRVSSGPIQFGSDWPGCFIRGDDALGYLLTLESLKECNSLDWNTRAVLTDLAALLKRSQMPADALKLPDPYAQPIAPDEDG